MENVRNGNELAVQLLGMEFAFYDMGNKMNQAFGGTPLNGSGYLGGYLASIREACGGTNYEIREAISDADGRFKSLYDQYYLEYQQALNNNKSSPASKHINKNTSTKPTSTTSAINRSIESFLVRFYRVGEENPASKVLPYYADTVDRYFSMKNVNKNDILKDKAKYYKRWVKRKYRLLNFEVVDTTSSSRASLHTVRVTIEWEVTSAKGTVKRGKSTNTIELYEDSNGFVVTSIK